MPSDPTSHLVEARIREAQARGELDNLPGQGKPLDLDDLNGLTAEQRFETLLLRSCGEVSEEAALAREIRECRDELASCQDDTRRERLRMQLREKAERFAAKIAEARRSQSLAHARKEER